MKNAESSQMGNNEYFVCFRYRGNWYNQKDEILELVTSDDKNTKQVKQKLCPLAECFNCVFRWLSRVYVAELLR